MNLQLRNERFNKIGKLISIEYERDGHIYKHVFNKSGKGTANIYGSKKPILIVVGDFKTTNSQGIIDKGDLKNPKLSRKVLAWKRRQRHGSIMKPSTFKRIERKAAAQYGQARGKAVAGAAYYKTLKAKYAKKKNPYPNPDYNNLTEGQKELDLYIENDKQLYEGQFKIIINNIKRRMKQGTYEPEKAIKLWQYLIDNGARRYNKEFGTVGQNISAIFPKSERVGLATYYEHYYRQQIEQGEY